MRFQVRRARQRTQRIDRVVLTVRLSFGFSERVKCRTVVMVMAVMDRMETVRSYYGQSGFEKAKRVWGMLHLARTRRKVQGMP